MKKHKQWFLPAASVVGLLLTALIAAPAFAQWMGGGMDGRGMWGGRMCRMMDVTPQPINPAALPEPESAGAGVLKTKCTQCHGLVSPKQHSAQDWPYIVDRMDRRMQMMSHGRMGMMRSTIAPLSAEEKNDLIRYLQTNAFQALDPGALPEGETPGAQSFADVCSRCHALPDPNAHSPREWQAVVERMAMNMENVGFGPLAPEQRTAILDYLKGQSRK